MPNIMGDYPSPEDIGHESGSVNHDIFSPFFALAISRSWRRLSDTQQLNATRKALAFQRRLEIASRDLELLCLDQSAGTPGHDAHQNAIGTLASDIAISGAGLKAFLSDFAATNLFNERRSRGTVPAKRVFGISELLERILSFLSPRDLLWAQQVDTTMRDMIEESNSLQRKLYLRPSADDAFFDSPFPLACDPFTFPFHDFPGLLISYTTPSREHNGFLEGPKTSDLSTHRLNFTVRVDFAIKHESRRLGSRSREMLICQPPVRKIYVYPQCCALNPFEYDSSRLVEDPLRPIVRWPLTPNPPDTPYKPTEVVTSTTGITVGDLYDAAIRAGQDHRLCPLADPRDHDDKGDVQVRVSFGCSIDLQNDDPASRKSPFNGTSPPMLPFESHESRAAKFFAYADAKYDAFEQGRPVPTYAEFKAMENEARQIEHASSDV